MDVKFYATTSSRLPSLPVINGQLIYLEDIDASYYDMGNSRHPISGVRLVSALPSTGQQANMLYVVIDQGGTAKASVWDSTSQTYKSLSSDIATTANAGLVKPDGTTITISNDGTISCHAEVTSLPATAITYDNTTSGTTATNAQGALDEIAAGVDDAADKATGAQQDADYALTQLGTVISTIEAMETRLQAVEAIAARALITEDPVSQNND